MTDLSKHQVEKSCYTIPDLCGTEILRQIWQKNPHVLWQPDMGSYLFPWGRRSFVCCIRAIDALPSTRFVRSQDPDPLSCIIYRSSFRRHYSGGLCARFLVFFSRRGFVPTPPSYSWDEEPPSSIGLLVSQVVRVFQIVSSLFKGMRKAIHAALLLSYRWHSMISFIFVDRDEASNNVHGWLRLQRPLPKSGPSSWKACIKFLFSVHLEHRAEMERMLEGPL